MIAMMPLQVDSCLSAVMILAMPLFILKPLRKKAHPNKSDGLISPPVGFLLISRLDRSEVPYRSSQGSRPRRYSTRMNESSLHSVRTQHTRIYSLALDFYFRRTLNRSTSSVLLFRCRESIGCSTVLQLVASWVFSGKFFQTLEEPIFADFIGLWHRFVHNEESAIC
jgi:hypothetical protein